MRFKGAIVSIFLLWQVEKWLLTAGCYKKQHWCSNECLQIPHLLQCGKESFQGHCSTQQGFWGQHHWRLLYYPLPLLGGGHWRGFGHRLATQERKNNNFCRSLANRVHHIPIFVVQIHKTHTHTLTCSVCLLSLECSTADTVAREMPGLTSEGTRELAS